jgi:glycosyltransferase involved in cell wall biosynthesis
MIVKNEINHLQELLPILEEMSKDIEIVIVDTGSTDGTKEFLKNKNNIIYQEIVWNHDFAAARNVSLGLCTGDYILVLDADERPDETFYPTFLNEIKKGNEAFGIKFFHLDDRGVSSSSHETTRLFKNNSGYYFNGKIHEQILNEKPFIHSSSSLFVKHLGYSKKEMKRKDKHKRNKEILLAILKDEPNNIFQRNNLAQDYLGANNYKKALEECNKVLRSGPVQERDLLRTYEIIIKSHILLKNYDLVLKKVNEIRILLHCDTHFLLDEGFVFLEIGRFYDAEFAFKKVIEDFTNGLSILKLNDVIVALTKLLEMYTSKRQFVEFDKTFLILKNLQKQNIGIELFMLKHISTTMDEEQLFNYISNTDIPEEKIELLYFEYHNKKGIKNLQLKDISSKKNRVLKLWYSKKYTESFTEYELLDNVDKNKVLAVLFVENLNSKNKKTTEILKKDKTLSMFLDIIEGKEVLNKNYSSVTYLLVIEELLKCKNFIIFEKLIGIFPMFSHTITLKIAEYLDSYYFDDLSISLYFEYLLKSPSDGVVWTRLAELLYINKRYEEAYVSVQRAIETNPHSFKPIEILLLNIKENNLLSENIELINSVTLSIGTSEFMKYINTLSTK